MSDEGAWDCRRRRDEIEVFETFSALRGFGSDAKGGTGLGLAIVKGFAEAMGMAVCGGEHAVMPSGRPCFSACLPRDGLLVRETMARRASTMSRLQAKILIDR